MSNTKSVSVLVCEKRPLIPNLKKGHNSVKYEKRIMILAKVVEVKKVY